MNDPETVGLLLARARQYIDTADLVRTHGDYDSAVSRLYYAMFYCAEALLLTRGLTFSKHQAVIAAFGRQFARTKLLPSELHNWLLDAFAGRQRSEYDVRQPATETAVVDLQQKASA